MNEWKDFFVAVAGAAAALTGLIFVGVSINLVRIISYPGLPERALLSLILLLVILVISCLLLIPAQTIQCAGIEILVAGILVCVTSWKIDLKILKITKPEFRSRFKFMVILSQFATLPYIASGVITLYNGESGIYWIVPAIIFSFVKSILDAWVLLVEINR